MKKVAWSVAFDIEIGSVGAVDTGYDMWKISRWCLHQKKVIIRDTINVD